MSGLSVVMVYNQLEVIYNSGIRRINPIYIRAIDRNKFNTQLKTQFTDRSNVKIIINSVVKQMDYTINGQTVVYKDRKLWRIREDNNENQLIPNTSNISNEVMTAPVVENSDANTVITGSDESSETNDNNISIVSQTEGPIDESIGEQNMNKNSSKVSNKCKANPKLRPNSNEFEFNEQNKCIIKSKNTTITTTKENPKLRPNSNKKKKNSSKIKVKVIQRQTPLSLKHFQRRKLILHLADEYSDQDLKIRLILNRLVKYLIHR